MSSTRVSSPLSESSPPTPSQLTPNSKVKAMLAAFDDSDDSDEEGVSGSARVKLALAIANEKSPSKRGSSRQTSPVSDANKDVSMAEKDDEEEDDEEEEDIVRPKGRLAARMQAAIESSDEEPTAGTARERVKKMLMMKSKSPKPATNAKSDNSDENDSPLVSRKRKIRVPRSGTPAISPRAKSASPGLFVSPSARRTASPAAADSDSDELLTDITSNDRFKALIAKKRQERLEKEAEKAKKAVERKKLAATLDEDDEQDYSDDNVERRLTQSQRPTRRAGKKALEEMHRETQRLSRSMQLAHQAKTNKKITKASLFAKFNYKPAGFSEDVAEPVEPASSSSPSAPHSDVEMRETPPTSPVVHGSPLGKSAEQVDTLMTMDEPEHQLEEYLPTTEDASAQISSSPPAMIGNAKEKAIKEASSPPLVDKGKGKATENETVPELPEKKTLFKQRPIRIRPPKMADRNVSTLDDSDSDLEIVTVKTPRKMKMDAIFNRVPAKKAAEASSLHALRMLAHLTSPGKQTRGTNTKTSMNPIELQISLQQRARQQATREREERLQALRDKGIIVQTAEEREKELAEVEDLIAKARREGEEIMKREKAAAKKERKANGEVDPLGDSSDDEDWQEEKADPAEDLSGSGSDSENEETGESEEEDSGEEDRMTLDNEENAGSAALNQLIEDEADDSDLDETAEKEADLSNNEGMDEDGDAEDEDETVPVNTKNRRARKTNVISDDEDEDDKDDLPTAQLTNTSMLFESPIQRRKDSSVAPNSVLRSATKTFIPGLTVAGPAGLSLTQIFQGTMDDSQMEPSATELNSVSQYKATEHDPMAFLRGLPAPSLPPFEPTMDEDTQEDIIVDSQSLLSRIPESQPTETQSETQGIQLDFSQSQIHGFDSLPQEPMATQLSEFPDATQDGGFVHRTPIRGRFAEAPPSTVDTLVLEPTSLPDTMEETPIGKKKGKLRRRVQVAAFSDDEDAAMDTDEGELEISAFDVMRKASKKKEVVVDDFDKKKSKAKEMVNEQAEESEDEYAGLGGVSDDESGGEEDDYVKEMIDDAEGKEVDESKLAAFYADRERANDEKQVEKLYNDITRGMLRRKRGADYDLSDSDDGGEAKRRRKRKEFAKMRKALLADERIGKIAENPKKQAFLRAIEDRGSEDEMDFLDDFAEQDEASDSQSQSQGGDSQQIVPDSQPDISMGPPKRKHSGHTYAENRPPPHLRRTQQSKKPSNISEIRDSLSSLIEEPNAMIMPEDSSSDSDGELEIEEVPEGESRREKEKENRDPFALRRSKVSVIDRILVKRASSNASSGNTRLAFAVSSSASGFKVPPLLRRATTNSSITSSTSSSVSDGTSLTERMAGGSSSDGIKRGGGKNSGINYFARESERKAVLVKTEKKREQKRFEGAEVRRKVVGGLFGGGKFE